MPYEKSFYARDQQAWRQWLSEHHGSEDHVWLIIYKKESSTPSIYYPEAVDEALCFGWVDSKPNKRDEESYYQYFARRKPKSNWSTVNKKKVARLIKEGRMEAPGMQMIEIAKANGTWTALDKVDALEVPEDLQKALAASPEAQRHFDAFPPSSKKIILEWIHNAKRPETRQNRITETVEKAAQNIRANHYRQPKGK